LLPAAVTLDSQQQLLMPALVETAPLRSCANMHVIQARYAARTRANTVSGATLQQICMLLRSGSEPSEGG
jgi:hypothetical protein